jgi:hypothetical protein
VYEVGSTQVPLQVHESRISSRLFGQFRAARVPFLPTGARIRRLAFGITVTRFWGKKEALFWIYLCVRISLTLLCTI